MSKGDKGDYGPTCNARFWPEPHERSCQLPPGHAGDHSDSPEYVAQVAAVASAAERFFILQWAGDRPGVLSLLRSLKDANYDETGTEYLRRIVSRAPFKSVGTTHEVSEVDYSQALPPPKPIRGPTVPLEVAVPEWFAAKCANCGLSMSVGKHLARGAGCCEVPV